MLRMLIVDDERIDREGVNYLVKKYEFPIETCMADSVEQAVSVLQEQPVDILFTDICMPEQSGLELIRQVKEINPQINCVIYSAHGEFEYAKQAMEYHVRHYILKPLKMEEFKETMQKVIDDCDIMQSDRQKQQVLRMVLLGESRNDGAWALSGFTVLVNFSRPVFVEEGNQMERLIAQVFGEGLCVSLNEFQALLFAKGSPEEIKDRAEDFCRETGKNPDVVTTVVLGEEILSAEHLLSVYARMEAKLDSKFFARGSRVISIFEDDKSYSADYLEEMQDLETYIRRKEKSKAIGAVDVLFQRLAEEGAMSPLYLKSICSDMVRRSLKTDETVLEKTIVRLFQCADVYALKDEFKSVLDEIMQDDKNSAEKAIDKVLEIIEGEYSKDISLEQIAERIFLSPSYLSYYFKKETGQNFIKYLTVFRLEKAKSLLRTTDLKIVAVSEQVGYMNSSYFCLMFKSYTGMTPTEYREES